MAAEFGLSGAESEFERMQAARATTARTAAAGRASREVSGSGDTSARDRGPPEPWHAGDEARLDLGDLVATGELSSCPSIGIDPEG
jgi:hypothetical protein